MIERHIGAISVDGEVVDRELSVLMDRRETGGWTYWSGLIELPPSSRVSSISQLDKKYRLRLEDGREADILISREDVDSMSGRRIAFTVSGPFAFSSN